MVSSFVRKNVNHEVDKSTRKRKWGLKRIVVLRRVVDHAGTCFKYGGALGVALRDYPVILDKLTFEVPTGVGVRGIASMFGNAQAIVDQSTTTETLDFVHDYVDGNQLLKNVGYIPSGPSGDLYQVEKQDSWPQIREKHDAWSKHHWLQEVDVSAVKDLTHKAWIDGVAVGFHFPELTTDLWPREIKDPDRFRLLVGPNSHLPRPTLAHYLDGVLWAASTWGSGGEFGRGPKALTPDEVKNLEDVWLHWSHIKMAQWKSYDLERGLSPNIFDRNIFGRH
jgi:hypothetical protein